MSFKSGPEYAESETWEGIPHLPHQQGLRCRRGVYIICVCPNMYPDVWAFSSSTLLCTGVYHKCTPVFVSATN